MTIPSSSGRIHHLDLGDAELGDLLDHRLGERLEGARHHQALVLVHRVLDQHLVRQVFALLGFLDAEFLDVVEQLQDLLVRAAVLVWVLALGFAVQEGQRAEEGRGQEFPAALLAVQIDVEQVAGVELRFVPGAAVGNDAEGMQHLAVRDAGWPRRPDPGERCNWLTMTRSAPLMTKVPCGVISGSSPMNTFSSLVALLLLEQEGDVQRRAVGQAFAQAFQPVHLGLADLVGVEIEHALPVVALDGEDLGENGLQPEVLPLGRRHLRLQELLVGIGLQFDQVRRSDDFFDFAEINSFSCSRWHLDLY